MPNVDWSDPSVRLIDLNGDGHADLLVSEHDCFAWSPSAVKSGFEPEQRVANATDEEHGPRIVFTDAEQSIYLADFCGDGLTDIVRIRNGSICYWPNLGHGRFGARVSMSNAPAFDISDAFDQRRIRLADIDGSGTTDIVYLHDQGLSYWINESGNSWSPRRHIKQFPPVDNLSTVSVVDLLGNGTACVVWSSPLDGDRHAPLRYIDLMSGRKPYLLTEVNNNIGGLTRIRYAPSTRFYLDDRRRGQPWITKIPFPVQVVERTEVFDEVTGSRFVSRFAYHHGYFDGEEREFRGFGMVEQFDTETFASFADGDLFPPGTNVDESSHVPPMLTRTWFHTGCFTDRHNISLQYAGEYYADDPDAVNLPDTRLPAGLSVAEARQACRALKGSPLRLEVYAQDGSSLAEHPYSVTETQYQVRRVQPLADNNHAVFLVFPEQSVSYHYERQPLDPRVVQQLTLDVDEFGNTTRSVEVAHPRRGNNHPIEQQRLLATCQEADFINTGG